MDISKLSPILNKESILKTANAVELRENPQDVLQRYHTYAMTHVPLGNTTKQLDDLERVVVENKTCAIGTIVGPYGYGKTSTAVHLWNETRGQKILSVPPFVWTSLTELMDAVYYWVSFEFSQGPTTFIPELTEAYEKYRQSSITELSTRIGNEDLVRQLIEEGRLNLEISASDVVNFFSSTSLIAEKAGFRGLLIYTDELQVTLSKYPSRDQFFSHLFDMVRDILGTSGHWAIVFTMNEDIEATISRLRLDLLQRLQRSALHFRVKDVYNRREYPKELWKEFAKRFGFNAETILLSETLDSMGEIASREDLGAGPRMVTNAMALGIKHYDKTGEPYTPIHLVNDFLAGLMVFDQRGKFGSSVKKALDNSEVRTAQANQQLIKLLSAFPMGCTEEMLAKYELLSTFQSFPPLARRELIVQLSGGYILRYLAEVETQPEQIEQRLTKEFVGRFSPNKDYAVKAANGFFLQFLAEPTFKDWKSEKPSLQKLDGVQFISMLTRGTFDPKYPDRIVHVMTTAVSQSAPPNFAKFHPDAEFEYRFELNYSLAPAEPSRLLVDSSQPNVAIFQLNISSINAELANRQIPEYLFEYYSPDQFSPLLSLSLIEYLYRNRGELPDDQNRIATIISPLRQFSLSMLLGEKLEIDNSDFASGMVGVDRVKELFRLQCRKIYPNYKTLATSKSWQPNLQQYRYALERVITQDGISIARGRNEWGATKSTVAEAFHIAGKSMTRLEVLVRELAEGGVLETVNFAGRQAYSEVSLKFKLHPLENEWLRSLDNSKQHTNVQGSMVPAIAAEDLFKFGSKAGYTLEEMSEVLQLLKTRKYIDQRQNLIVRTIDAIDDLRESVSAFLDQIEASIVALRDGLPEFEDTRYPLMKMRTDLANAKERDEIELLRSKLREWSGSINSFIGARSSSIRQKITDEQNKLHELNRQGIPLWINYAFEPNPLVNQLEKQRSNRVLSYQNTLDDMRKLREVSIRALQDTSGSSVDILLKLYNLLRDLSDKSSRLGRKLESLRDEQQDMTAWREVAKMTAEVDTKVRSINQTYDYKEFLDLADQLWKVLQNEFETDPLSIFSKHQNARQRIEQLEKRIADWVENRRRDFEQKCQSYQLVLNQAGLQIDLKVPFDPEHPNASVDALLNQVNSGLQRYLSVLSSTIVQAVTTIRYSIKVQKLPLEKVEHQALKALQIAEQLQKELTAEKLGDFEIFKGVIIQQLVILATEEQSLRSEVQTAIQKKKPEGSEIRLMEMLDGSTQSQRADLRGLIIRMLESGDDSVDLDDLMVSITSLFKKNQVSVFIIPQGEERKMD